MNQKQQLNQKTKQRAAIGLVVCFATVVALTATYTWNNYRDRLEQEQARAEEEMERQREQLSSDLTEQANAVARKAQEDAKDESGAAKAVDTRDEAVPFAREQGGADSEGEAPAADAQANESQPTAGGTSQVSFSEEDHLLWPVDGNVIMSFSMDHTMYFSTLDQYKYNPALVLSGAVGDNVIASAPGIVKSIDVLAQTGTTVTVDMGNGYEILYGQLKEVPVMTGDYVEAGTVIGYLSEPTKYYSVEGCNLYFEMRKDGLPVDPMNYLVDDADE